MGTSVEVEVESRRLALSNLDKVLFPDDGFRKGDVIDYYRRVAPVLLRHLSRRAPTLVRAPDGPDGSVFFEKRCPPSSPDWVQTSIVGRYGRHRGYEACLIDDLPTLIWAANLAALELHTHQATVDDPATPTAVVLDLDPGEPATIVECCEVAIEIRAVLERLDLVAVAKSSGGKGLHLSVPVNNPNVDAGRTKELALAVGQFLEQQAPAAVTTNMAKAQRPGRVFIDWSQNDRFKTTVAPYSLRIGRTARVSAPVTWEEVEAVAQRERADLVFHPTEVLERVETLGDLYSDNLDSSQNLPELGS